MERVVEVSDKGKKTENLIDLFYMTSGEVAAKDIAEIFRNKKGITVQLWEEMNVLELELPNGNGMDFESMEPRFQDPSDMAFIKNRNIRTIFAITLYEADLQGAVPYFEQIIERYSGFVCSDTEDFQPVYAGSSQRVN